MNYYPRHIGDYMRDAGHLTMLEHGAYTLLLDIYYASEQGISDNNHLHKSLGAKSKDEKAAIDYVLNRFFSLKNGIWVNKRAEKEIKKSRKRISLSQSNGRRGGRPKLEENNEKIEEKNPIRRKPKQQVILDQGLGTWSAKVRAMSILRMNATSLNMHKKL